ncbi:hypothetical protein SAMN05443663_106211 [Flavobacterium defluvii]|uniref:Uncharacterized protein n=1 Tax=Flavobacterium defluvii TaxID=370979 RepID=A0A1M5RH77_9FLAO|nr:hypothetical protein SAMN05443663_106211 [Flavobacterium defluvii]
MVLIENLSPYTLYFIKLKPNSINHPNTEIVILRFYIFTPYYYGKFRSGCL